MSEKPLKRKQLPQESDIVIRPDGTIHISFLWNDSVDTIPQERFSSVAEPSLVEYQNCKLCPKECGFDRIKGTHPTCGDFKLRISTAGLTLGDEKEIRGELGSGAIMLSGCPLKCPSCHNPEMVKNGVPVSAAQFVETAFDLAERGASNLQILSPTVHLPALRTVFKHLKRSEFPIPILLKSSGYEKIEELKALEGLVDIYLPDLKFGSSSLWARRAGVPDYFRIATDAIHEMYRQVGPLVLNEKGAAQRGLFIRHVKAPLPETERAEILRFLAALPKGVGVSITDNFVQLE